MGTIYHDTPALWSTSFLVSRLVIRQVFAPLRRRRMPWTSTWIAGDAKGPGPLGHFGGFSMFQQQTCAMYVFSMLLIQWLVRTSTFWDGLVQPAGETKVNQALQVFRNIDPPIEGQEVGTSGFGNGIDDRKTKNTPKSRTYSMTWISKQVILVIVFKFLAVARGLGQAGDCAVYLWATKGSNLVYKLGVGTRCGFCQISQQGFVNATFAVEKFVNVAHFLNDDLFESIRCTLFATVIQEWSQSRVSQVVQVVFESQNESKMKLSVQKHIERSLNKINKAGGVDRRSEWPLPGSPGGNCLRRGSMVVSPMVGSWEHGAAICSLGSWPQVVCSFVLEFLGYLGMFWHLMTK